MQIQDQPHIGVLGADPAAITQFLRRVQALGGEHAVLLPLSPAAVPDCEPYLCGASTQPPLPKLRAAAEVLAASGCTVIAVPDSAGIFCELVCCVALLERLIKILLDIRGAYCSGAYGKYSG